MSRNVLPGGVVLILALAGGRLAAAEPPFHAQQAPRWCWAAASQMMLEAAAPDRQFLQAAQAFQAFRPRCSELVQNTCGRSQPFYGPCGRSGLPIFDRLGFDVQVSRSPLPWSDLEAELNAGRPVLFGWCLKNQCGRTVLDSRGHLMVAPAAPTCGGGEGPVVHMVKIFNPAPCCRGQVAWIPYSLYAEPQLMSFWLNYLQLKPKIVDEPAPESPARGSAIGQARPEVDNFAAAADPAALLDTLNTACFGDGVSWQGSGLLRDQDFAKSIGRVKLGQGVRREIRSLADLPATAQQLVDSAKKRPSPLWAYPILVDGDTSPIANLVVEEVAPYSYRLVAIEDSKAAKTLEVQAEKAKGKAEDRVQLLILDFMAPVLIDGETAIAVTSDLECWYPRSVEAQILEIAYSDLWRRLAKL